MNRIVLVSATKMEHDGFDMMFTLPIFQIGIGKINASMNLQKIIDDYKPDTVINFGSCGNLKNHPIGKVLKVGSVHNDIDCRPYAEYGITAEDEIGSIKISETDIDLFTTDIIYNKNRTDYSDSYLSMINSCDIVDMEGYALAYVCRKNKVHFQSYKWVSDDGDVENWTKNAAIGFKNFSYIIEELYYSDF